MRSGVRAARGFVFRRAIQNADSLCSGAIFLAKKAPRRADFRDHPTKALPLRAPKRIPQGFFATLSRDNEPWGSLFHHRCYDSGLARRQHLLCKWPSRHSASPLDFQKLFTNNRNELGRPAIPSLRRHCNDPLRQKPEPLRIVSGIRRTKHAVQAHDIYYGLVYNIYIDSNRGGRPRKKKSPARWPDLSGSSLKGTPIPHSQKNYHWLY